MAMTRRATGVLAMRLVTGLTLAGCTRGTGAAGSGTTTVTVFAAASLRTAFSEIAGLDAGLHVRFTFDGSASLLDQLAAGAPADVLATADEATMTRALDAGLVRSPSRRFAANTLTLVVPAGNPGAVTGLDGSLAGVKLVVCAPEVPCGAATRTLASKLGVRLHPVSEETSVSAVLGRVASGEADAGLVYVTDATAAGSAVDTITVPGSALVTNRYAIAQVTGTGNADPAQRFIDLVLSQRGRAVLERYGFAAP